MQQQQQQQSRHGDDATGRGRADSDGDEKTRRALSSDRSGVVANSVLGGRWTRSRWCIFGLGATCGRAGSVHPACTRPLDPPQTNRFTSTRTRMKQAECGMGPGIPLATLDACLTAVPASPQALVPCLDTSRRRPEKMRYPGRVYVLTCLFTNNTFGDSRICLFSTLRFLSIGHHNARTTLRTLHDESCRDASIYDPVAVRTK